MKIFVPILVLILLIVIAAEVKRVIAVSTMNAVRARQWHVRQGYDRTGNGRYPQITTRVQIVVLDIRYRSERRHRSARRHRGARRKWDESDPRDDGGAVDPRRSTRPWGYDVHGRQIRKRSHRSECVPDRRLFLRALGASGRFDDGDSDQEPGHSERPRPCGTPVRLTCVSQHVDDPAFELTQTSHRQRNCRYSAHRRHRLSDIEEMFCVLGRLRAE